MACSAYYSPSKITNLLKIACVLEAISDINQTRLLIEIFFSIPGEQFQHLNLASHSIIPIELSYI